METKEIAEPINCESTVNSCSSGDEATPLLVNDGNGETRNGESRTPQKEKLTRKKWLVIICLLVLSFLDASCYALLSPFFPEEASMKGMNEVEIGFVFGIFEAIGMISSPIFGKYVSIVGAKFMCVTGVMICASCSALFGLLQYCPPGNIYFVMCVLTRSLEALGSAAYFTSSFSIISVMFRDRVSQMFGFQEMASSLGFMISPLIGGFLYEAGGYGLPFYLMASVLLIFAVVCIYVLPSMDEGIPSTGSFLTLLLIPKVLWITTLVSMTSFVISFFNPVWEPFLKGFGLTPLYVGLSSTVFSLFYGLPSPIWGHFAGRGRFYRLVMIQSGCLVIAISYFMIGPAPFFNIKPELWISFVSAGYMFFAFGPLIVPQFEELLDAARDSGRPDNIETNGQISGLFNSAFNFGAFSSPLIAGALYDKFGFGWASTSYGAVMLLVVVVSQVFLIVSKSKTAVTVKISEVP